MAITALGTILPFPDPMRAPNSAYSSTGYILDATGEKVAFMFQLPKTGTITKVGFRVVAVTTAETLRVSLQTIGADGFPTGTLFGGSAAGTLASPAANTAYEVTLATGATVGSGDVGDWVAVVIEFDSLVGNVRIGTAPKITTRHAPYIATDNGSTWSRANGPASAWIGYSDGTYPDVGWLPAANQANQLFDSGTTPDEYGVAFTLPVSVRAVGVWFVGGIAVSGDHELVLYQGTTVLATLVRDGDAVGQQGTSTHELTFAMFESPVTLAAATEYIVAMRPTTLADVTLRYIDVTAAAVLEAWAGTGVYQKSRTDQGAWSDTLTRRPMIGILFDGVDVSGGGGGGGETFTGSQFNRGFN